MDQRQTDPSGRTCAPQTHDLLMLALSLVFSLLFFTHPDGRSMSLLGARFPTNLAAGSFFLFFALLCILAAFVVEGRDHHFFVFARTFYPQAMFGFFFIASIQLSALVAGGVPRDAIFAAADQVIFGFQPAIAFSARFSTLAWFNELMFGGYFLFYILFTITPWIPWFLGRREEARRQIITMSVFMFFLYPFYVFFRVMGPKFWFPELNAAWYGHFSGGFFVHTFQLIFDSITLSGAAFPSAHVAFTTLGVLFAARTDRRLLILYIPAWALVLASTVYIYAHYVVDGIAGTLLALILGPLLLRDARGLSRGDAFAAEAGR